jgi:hypothetical protein
LDYETGVQNKLSQTDSPSVPQIKQNRDKQYTLFYKPKLEQKKAA